MSSHVLAVDFGGTKIAAAIVDAASGAIQAHTRRPTPAHEGARASVAVALEACDELLRAGSPTAIGISFGGPVNAARTHVIRSMHVGAWSDAPLPEIFSEHFGMPATLENDANAAALAEAVHGAGSRDRVVLYVQVSTGIGAGLVVDGVLYRGRAGAGELGHLVVDPEGPPCGCGNSGCLEAIASGWALARDAASVQGAGASAETLFAAARDGDEPARAIVEHAFSALGMALAGCINLLDPARVVLGGGIVNASDVLLPIVRAKLADHVVPHLRDPDRLVLSGLGPDAPLVGAAMLASARERHLQLEPL